jgi:hypothetical protein
MAAEWSGLLGGGCCWLGLGLGEVPAGGCQQTKDCEVRAVWHTLQRLHKHATIQSRLPGMQHGFRP